MSKGSLIVVGSGVVGLSIALEMSSDFDVTCISPRDYAHSATLAAGAMLGVHGENSFDKNTMLDRREFVLRSSSNKIYEEWIYKISQFSDDVPKIERGTTIIANSAGKDDIRNIDYIESYCDKEGDQCEWINPDEIEGLRPHRTYRPFKALHIPNEGFINATHLHASLIKTCLRVGVNFIDDYVTEVLGENKIVRGVVTKNKQRYFADEIILCSGVNTQKIMGKYIQLANLPKIYGGKGSSLLMEVPINLKHVIRTPNRDFACGMHVVPRGNGLIYVGATNRVSDTPGVSEGVTAGEIHVQLHGLLHEINTSFRTCIVKSTISGIRPLTSDGYPLFGKTSVQGLSVATGTYRNGILLAPIIAKEIRSEIEGEGESNLFSPLNRTKLAEERKDYSSILELGVRDLVSFIQEPHGMLPYERAIELEKFITVLLKESLGEAEKSSLYDAACFERREDIVNLFYNSQDVGDV